MTQQPKTRAMEASVAKLVDVALDRTIAPGYGNLGVVVRRRLPTWPPDPPRMEGRVVLVTGAASGLGLATCRGFAALGASVRALARSQRRADEAVAQVSETVPGADITAVACDLSSLAQVRELTERIGRDEPRLDVLVNNAGVMPDERERSEDGHELMFATHVLAPFALIAWLRPLLERSAPARVINVGSGGLYSQAIPAGDLESDQTTYSPKKLYARSKREQLVITEQWAQRLDGSGIVVHAMHPGWVDTPGVSRWMPVFRAVTRPIIRSEDQGADTIVWLGASPEALRSTGGFWHDRRLRPTHYRLGASDDAPQTREALWDYCCAQIERPAPAATQSPG